MKKAIYFLFSTVFVITSVVSCSRNQEKTPTIEQLSTEASSALFFNYNDWIEKGLANQPFTEDQSIFISETLTLVFDKLDGIIQSELIESLQWKSIHHYEKWGIYSIRRKMARKISFLDRGSYQVLYKEMNQRLIKSEVSFKSIEYLINDAIFRFNENHPQERLQSVTLPRLYEKDLINAEMVKNIFFEIDRENKLKNKEIKEAVSNLFISLISFQYATFFDKNHLFEQMVNIS